MSGNSNQRRRERRRRVREGMPIASPAKQNKQTIQQEQAVAERHMLGMVVEQHQGPLPSPQVIERYEQICPGSAKALFDAFHVEGEHRRHLQIKVVDSQIEDERRGRDEAKRGQVFAFILCMTAIICGTVAAVYGYQVAGSIIGGGGLAGLASVFIVGRFVKPPDPGNQRADNMKKSE